MPFGVYAQLYHDSGNAVGGEFLVNTEIASDQDEPEGAALSDGGFVVVYRSVDASFDGIMAQRFDVSGDKVGDETAVNTTTTDNQSTPHVAALADGGFAVVWESSNNDTDGMGVCLQIFGADGAKRGDEQLVNETTVDDQENPRVATTESGVIVTWTSYDDTYEYEICARHYDVTLNKPATNLPPSGGGSSVVGSLTLSDDVESTGSLLADYGSGAITDPEGEALVVATIRVGGVA